MGTSLLSIRAMLRVDTLRLLRDRFLGGTLLFVVLVAASLRFLIPLIASELRARFGFELEPWFPLMTGYFAQVQAAMLVGMAGGFLLLEMRTQHTVRALLVSPVPLWLYLLVLGVGLTLAAWLLSVVQALLVGVGRPPLGPLLFTSLAGAPAAVTVALFIGTAASNEVEAFAQMKFLSAAGLIPVAAWFAPSEWQWLGGLYPPYWAVRGFWLAEAGKNGWLLSASAGFLFTLLVAFLLSRSFARRAAR